MCIITCALTFFFFGWLLLLSSIALTATERDPRAHNSGHLAKHWRSHAIVVEFVQTPGQTKENSKSPNRQKATKADVASVAALLPQLPGILNRFHPEVRAAVNDPDLNLLNVCLYVV